MYIGSILRNWLFDYMHLQLYEYEYERRRVKKVLWNYKYDITCSEGYDTPRLYKVYNSQQDFTHRVTIGVGKTWIKTHVPKDILAAAIAERMLYVEKSVNTKLSPPSKASYQFSCKNNHISREKLCREIHNY